MGLVGPLKIGVNVVDLIWAKLNVQYSLRDWSQSNKGLAMPVTCQFASPQDVRTKDSTCLFECLLIVAL